MKEIPCSYSKCGERRAHWAMQEKARGQVMCLVEDDYEGHVYCSFTCAIADGHMKLQTDEQRARYIERKKEEEDGN